MWEGQGTNLLPVRTDQGPFSGSHGSRSTYPETSVYPELSRWGARIYGPPSLPEEIEMVPIRRNDETGHRKEVNEKE